MAQNVRANLNNVMKKDKVFPHFMRVIPVPFKEIFQSELYSFQIKGEDDPKAEYNEEDLIMLQLMLLKIQYKTKTPSNTIRQLKYTTQAQFTAPLIKQIFTDLKEKAEADEQQRQLFQFFKEQIFRYHVFDTFPALLNQWKNEIADLYEPKEFPDYTNSFFYQSYDYYSININIIVRQMEDLFSVLPIEITKECIQKIFQIVLARIQGSLNEHKDIYINCLAKYYEGDDSFEPIQQKIQNYVTSEYEDDDYKAYEREFKEYDHCGQTLKEIKEAMPLTKHTPERLKMPEDLETEYTRIINEKLNIVEKLL